MEQPIFLPALPYCKHIASWKQEQYSFSDTKQKFVVLFWLRLLCCVMATLGNDKYPSFGFLGRPWRWLLPTWNQVAASEVPSFGVVPRGAATKSRRDHKFQESYNWNCHMNEGSSLVLHISKLDYGMCSPNKEYKKPGKKISLFLNPSLNWGSNVAAKEVTFYNMRRKDPKWCLSNKLCYSISFSWNSASFNRGKAD